MRFALALLLALFVGQALAYPAVAVLDRCAEACPDDRSDGTCEPICADCTCCSHAARPLGVLVSAIAPAFASECASAASPCSTAPEARPRDVFHVPRSLA